MLRRGKKSFSRQTEGHYVHLRYVNVEGNVKGANFSKVAALPNGTTLGNVFIFKKCTILKINSCFFLQEEYVKLLFYGT